MWKISAPLLGPLFPEETVIRSMTTTATTHPTSKVHSLEWLAAKQYATLCCLGLVDHHVEYLPSLPTQVRRKILFFFQQSFGSEELLMSLLEPGDITELNFSKVNSKINCNFMEAVRVCASLETLNMRAWRRGDVSDILQCTAPSLLTLNLSRSEAHVGDAEMFAIGSSCTNLIELNVARNDRVSDVGLFAIANCCTRLRTLDMSYLEVSSASFTKIMTSCLDLSSLNIKGCTGIISIAGGIGARRASLTSLNAKGVIKVPSFEWKAYLGPIFQRLRNLRMGDTTFDVSFFTPHTQDDGLEYALEVLDMSWCDGDSGGEESMLEKRKALPALIRKCTRLRKFKSRACDYVGDDAVLALADSCPYLEQANLARCHKIGDVAWERLSLNCPKINDLDISWSSATSESIEKILKHCPRLQRFSMEGCKQEVPEIEEAILGLNELVWINFSWVNSCSAAFANKLVSMKPDLCVCDYYGEQIKGKLFEAKE